MYLFVCSFLFRGGDSRAIEQIFSNVFVFGMPKYFANVVQADEIMQIYFQLFYNECSLHPTLVKFVQSVTYGSTISSEGVTKKEPFGSFCIVCPFGTTPIESIVFVFDNRNPRGVTLRHFA